MISCWTVHQSLVLWQVTRASCDLVSMTYMNIRRSGGRTMSCYVQETDSSSDNCNSVKRQVDDVTSAGAVSASEGQLAVRISRTEDRGQLS